MLTQKRAFLAAGIVLAMVFVMSGSVSVQAADEKFDALLVQGGGHDWKTHLKILADLLDGTGDFDVTLSGDLNELKKDSISEYDLVFFYGSGLNFSDREQEKGLCDFVRNGGAYAGAHSASDSFKKSDAYWELVGGRFAGHGHGTYTVHIHDKDHPITKGMEDFEITDESYQHRYHKNIRMRSLTCMMDKGRQRQSMCWVQDYGEGRVFYTANGHGHKAWTNPHFQRLLVRGIYWSLGQEPQNP